METRFPSGSPALDAGRSYSLAELIDIAERHNPETRIVWERAKQQASLLGVARSALYPLLSASALLNSSRNRVLFGDEFFRQDLAYLQPTLSLLYTILDFGNRREQVKAAASNLLAADFSFNDTHQRIIFDVTSAYYHLMGTEGQVTAAEATLASAQTVNDAVEARLANGLATLPDVLDARSSTAQASYELETARGSERIAHGQLALALGVSPAQEIRIASLPPEASFSGLEEPVEAAIARALRQRPDLLAQEARVRATEAEARQARSRYYPDLSFSGTGDYQYVWGSQQGNPSATTQGDTFLGELSMRWTIFDGGARFNELDRARSANREAEAQLNALRDRAEVEVWTAYTNVQTALREQQAAAAFLGAASGSYTSSVEAYQYGVKSFLDVSTAQRVLAQARLAQVIAQTRLLTSVADFAFRTGDLIRGEIIRAPGSGRDHKGPSHSGADH
jgi:outer membrane protein TolC